MASAFDPDRLPAALRPLVKRALEDVDGCEAAIEALEQHVAQGAAGPDALVALALVTYHEAAALVITQLEHASERALALLDEAERRGGARHRIERLRSMCKESLERERSRERRIVARMARADLPDELEAVELAHRLMMRGDSDLAVELLRRIDEGEAPRAIQARAAS